ncbi:PIN/TRAM domain-containing protein, partial [Staphylococcus aureus]|nr:PIN/TRAM domain-containing protein [Staphylococcus aureus]
MNIVKLMVIIIYLIIGSALGIIIIPEIANDLGLQNS